MKNKFLAVFFMLALSASAVMKSRAFFTGYCVSLCFILYILHKRRLRKKTKILVVCLSLFIPITLAFLFKPDSSLGRLFIYKISFTVLTDHFPSGIGISQFANTYRHYQASYFGKGHYTTQELLLADNTQYAFNDYLQFIIETGLTGLVILVASLYAIAASMKKALEKHDQPITLLLACSEIIAISVAAMFMHEFEKIEIQVLFILSMFIILFYALDISKRVTYITCSLLLGLLACFYHGAYLINYNKYNKLQEANNLFHTGYIRQSLIIYESLYPSFKTNSLYLGNYGDILSTSGRNKDAILVLKRAISLDNNYLFYKKIAECYLNEKMFTQAEGALLYTINMVPNRFEPRFDLFNLYESTGQKEKAFAIGQQILNLPVKINSVLVQRIQGEVRNMLKINYPTKNIINE